MASEVSNTLRGLQTVSHIANDGGESARPNDLTREVKAILSPDAATALKRRSEGTAAPRHLVHGGTSARSQREMREMTKRKEKSLSSINVEAKHYASDIKTTKEMADQVTNILGGAVLSNLAQSCHDRKKEQEKTKQKAPKISSKLTPEMREAMERNNSVAPQGKKTFVSADEEESSESEREEYGAKPGRIRRNRSADSHQDSHHHRSRDSSHSTGKHSGSRQGHKKSSSPPPPPPARHSHGSRSKSPVKKRSPRNIREYQKDFANHADDVGIDLEDGLDEVFDEEDAEHHSEEAHAAKKGMVKRQHSHQRRRQHPSKTVSGAKPGRRGRNGVRGGGGNKIADIKHAQIARMTQPDQTKQYHEEDYISDEEENFEQEEEEESHSDNETAATGKEGGWGFGGAAAFAVGWGGVAVGSANSAATTTMASVPGAAKAKDAAVGLGGAAVGAVNAAASTTMATVPGAAKARDAAVGLGEVAVGGAAKAKDAAVGLGGGFVGAINAAATTTISQVGKAVAPTKKKDSFGHSDGFSSDEEDNPMAKASSTGSDDEGASWGFTGGGFPS